MQLCVPEAGRLQTEACESSGQPCSALQECCLHGITCASHAGKPVLWALQGCCM